VLGRGIAAAPPTPLTRHDSVVTDGPPPGTTQAPGGLTTKTGMVAQGKVGATSWQVTVHPGSTSNDCYDVTFNGSSAIPAGGRCAYVLPRLDGGEPGDLTDSYDGRAVVTTLGVAAASVTYFVVTFTDGQQLKLIPVTVGSHRYVAWAAPEAMTVASLVAHLGTPYADSGRTETAIPFDPPGAIPVFGLWLLPGQAGPPRAHGFVASGTTAGQSWSVTAYEGPWGTCFATSDGSDCLPLRQLTTTAVLASVGAVSGEMTSVGSAAPGVAMLRFTLSDGTAIQVKPVTVGDERLFAFAVGAHLTATRYTAYDAAGQAIATGPVPK
ncbi:MAG TPA: hypothetical protein VGD91_28360, partial [Trebonia sp.]